MDRGDVVDCGGGLGGDERGIDSGLFPRIIDVKGVERGRNGNRGGILWERMRDVKQRALLPAPDRGPAH